jgi:Xaa-Pro aminopeptidase
MKTDIDGLIGSAGLDAIMVLGNAAHNPPMYYLVGGGHVNNAVLVKKKGLSPVLYCNAMERGEAAKSGLQLVPVNSSPIEALLKAPGEILEAQGLTRGRLGMYGTLDAGSLLGVVSAIRAACPDLEVLGEPKEDSIFLRAMETKDAGEIEQIRRMGGITIEVVSRVAALLTTSDVGADEVLLAENGVPLTVADVKSKIALWIAELGAENPEGCIFAIGSDAGLPHSAGTPEDPIRLGRTIVFDIFPSQAGGGYFYDFTRTWSLGYASSEAQALFDQVSAVYSHVLDEIRLNVAFKEYQKLVSDEFQKNGHDTLMHTEGVLEHGYVHSLGHGIGLNVHERPWSRHTAGDDNVLRPGVVITIEPGLYYPEKGMGARIEDTYWVRSDGALERLAEYPYDFVLPMPKWRSRRKS